MVPQPQVLFVRTRFEKQFWHVLAVAHVRQFVTLQATQVGADPVVRIVVLTGQTQFPPEILNVVSGQLQVLLVKVKFPVQFWHTFEEEQN